MKYVLTLVTAAMLYAPDFSLAQMSVTERLSPDRTPAVVAGSKAVDTGYPEQSLASFEWAINRGVDIIIIGVQKTADDQYIVMKDPTFTRTTNVREVYPDGPPRRNSGEMAAAWHLVNDYTLEEIGKLRLRDPSGDDHPVPLLKEVLELIAGRMLAVLRLDVYDPDSLTALLEAQEPKNILLFSWEDKAKLHEIMTATGIGAWDSLTDVRDTTATLEKLVDAYGSALKIVDVYTTQLSQDLIARAAELEVRLCIVSSVEDVALTSGDTAPWLDALNKPVAAFTTDYPDAVLGLLGR
ncbi:glycerophosphodiester phosphodiesterase [Marivita geojedonensis]|nr:glycerophosphodiester phosphodiesterase family protein [Marivita geojedonensis]